GRGRVVENERLFQAQGHDRSNGPRDGVVGGSRRVRQDDLDRPVGIGGLRAGGAGESKGECACRSFRQQAPSRQHVETHSGEVASARATKSVCPLPGLRGRVGEGAGTRESCRMPPSLSLPRKRERERTECAAQLCTHRKMKSLQLPRVTMPPPHGSGANLSRPIGLSVLASKVRISIAPPMSSVTAMRSSASAVETTRAPFGNSAVTSAPALPSALKTR